MLDDKEKYIYNHLFISFFKENPTSLFILIVLKILTLPISLILTSYFLSVIIDTIKSKKDIKDKLYWYCFLLIILFSLYYISWTVDNQILPSFYKFIRLKIIGGSILSRENSKEEINTVVEYAMTESLIDHLDQIFRRLIDYSLPYLLTNFCIPVYYLFINKFIALIYIGTEIVRMIIIFSFLPFLKKKAYEREKYYFQFADNFSDKMKNAFNIHLNNQFKKELDWINTDNDDYNKLVRKQINANKNFKYTMSYINVLIFLFRLIVYYRFLLEKKISEKIFVSLILIENRLLFISQDICYQLTLLISSLGNIQATKNTIYDNIKRFEEKDTNLENTCKTIVDGSVLLRNVSFRNSQSSYLFQNKNLFIASGKKLGITGRSGSGKTTLMKILLGFETNYEGEIYFGKLNIKNISLDTYRDNIVYVNQTTNLFNESVLYNIQYGNTIKEEEIMEFLKEHQLENIFEGLQDNIHHICGINGSELSSGMQKITIFLRGIFKSPKFFVFDEPLAGLDTNTRKIILDIIKAIPKTTTVIVITHNQRDFTPILDEIIDFHSF